MKRKSVVLLLVICFLTTFSNAQINREKAPDAAPTGLVLEVTFIKTIPPAYMSIAPAGTKNSTSWYAAFGRVPNFQLPPNALPVRAVNIVPLVEKDAVKVSVSVFKGLKFHEQQEAVAVYTIRENERVSVKELLNFGVEPFELAVVRVAPSVSILPSVENKTNSLQVNGIESQAATLPAYKISLLNTSDKAVNVFGYEVMANGNRAGLGSVPGNKDKPIIEAGGTFEIVIKSPLDRKKISNGEAAPTQGNQTIVITSVMFTDGSFEGDRSTAARFRAYALGRKSQLKQVISLIETNLNKPGQIDLNALAEQAQNLRVNVDEIQFNELIKDFSDLSEKDKNMVRLCIEVSLREIKMDFAKRMEMRLQTSASINDWLKDAREEYRNWLARLF